jgi:hypothetical protein
MVGANVAEVILGAEFRTSVFAIAGWELAKPSLAVTETSQVSPATVALDGTVSSPEKAD